MTGEKFEGTAQNSVVSPVRRGILLVVLAFIISAYAAYGLYHNDLSLAYFYDGRFSSKVRFTGTSAWLLAMAIWIVAAGLLIALFEGPNTVSDKAERLPKALADAAFLFVGAEALKKQRPSVLVGFVGIVIGGLILLLRMSGVI